MDDETWTSDEFGLVVVPDVGAALLVERGGGGVGAASGLDGDGLPWLEGEGGKV
ncbi:hypothetical protein ACGFX2_38320 [Streptomyces goshikiensis]|uniref:hypothetical protein n=1 Tax=Streptomyces goshikiensis TaxID=1942 RepID=UPI00371FB9B4